MTKILICGSSGFIGSYLFEHLSKQFKVEGEDIKMGKLYDIARSGYPIKQYDIIINCAVEIFNQDNMIYTNVLGVDNLSRYCKKRNAKLIHFSSVSIYGNSYYGLSKRMGEDLIRFWDLPNWVILRMTNVYQPKGKGDSPACRFSRGETEIFGNGLHTKDHIHIRNVLQAVQLAIKDNWHGEVNLASGTSLSINDIFARLGVGEAIHLRDKKVDMVESKLDNSEALSLGWKPTWDLKDVWEVEEE